MNHTRNHRAHSAGKSLLLGAAAMLVTMSAQAGVEPMEMPVTHKSAVVNYGDLNLGTSAGTQRLYARISAAASRVCGDRPDIRDLSQLTKYRACYDAAMDTAVLKVDNARLQALHAERKSSQSVG